MNEPDISTKNGFPEEARQAIRDAAFRLSSLENEVYNSDFRSTIAKNMTPTEIEELIANVRMYEIFHTPDGWPAVQTKELTQLAYALEQQTLLAIHWQQAYQEERAKYLNLINNK